MGIPGDTGEVAQYILDLVFMQLIKFWEFWKDDDRIAVYPTAPLEKQQRGKSQIEHINVFIM